MNDDHASKILAAADRVVELGEELEASGETTVDEAALERKRAALHQWIDGVKGVVVNPALGRVTLIHENGRTSSISSSDLPFALTAS